jgi:gluconolactonase
MPGFGVERPRQLGFQGVYKLMGGDILELLVERDLFDQPNGLCFSPDEAKLYINDTEKALIRVFDVLRDGSLSNGGCSPPAFARKRSRAFPTA